MARASPMASSAVELEVGARLSGQASLLTWALRATSEALAKEDSKYSYPLACAFEIFQTSILIHDDIIDHDDLRRGKKTIHSYNGEKYYNITKQELSYTLGNNIAICMGDLGFYEANKIIAKNYKDNSNLGEIINYFSLFVIESLCHVINCFIFSLNNRN